MALDIAEAADQLLGEGDTPPVHEVNAAGTSHFLLTADHYGGWAKITNQMVGGGLYAQRMATLRTYPSEAAKARARRVARIPVP